MSAVITPEVAPAGFGLVVTDSIIDSVDLPIIVVDGSGSVTRHNCAAATILHVRGSDVGRAISQIDGLGAAAATLQELAAGVIASAAPVERRLQLANSAWYLVRAVPLQLGDTKLAGAVLTFTNVTALHASVEQAIVEREFTKAVINTVPVALVVLDAGLRIQTASRAFFSLFGVSRDGVHGRPLQDVLEGQWDIPELHALLRRALAEGTPFAEFEVALASPPAGARTLLVSGRPLAGGAGRATLILMTIEDITRRKESEKALRDAERELRDFVDNASVGMHWVGPDGIIQWANRAELQMLGYSADQYIGHHMAEFHVDPENISEILTRLSGGESICERPARLRCRNGAIREVVINSNVLWQDGKFMHTRCFTQDVTDKKRMEEALLQSRLEAQQHAAALSDLHRRKDEFLAMLGHELRNPIAPIVNAVFLLGMQKDESPLQHQARTIIQRQVTQLTRLVDDLLDVSRITTGRIRLHEERLTISDVIQPAVDAVRGLIDQRRQTLTLTPSRQALWLHADAGRLQQVFVNLLTNASKFTDEGGRIAVTVEAEDRECVVRVADTGVGISPELLPHIFELFAQAPQSLERSQGGLGVGLALVHRLVTAHHGRVEAKSTLGRGSEFVVRLPLQDPPSLLKESSPDPGAAEHAASLDVLVVDDNRDMAESFASLLRGLGHDARSVFSATAALTEAQLKRPDVVLLDVGLPGMNGYELARQLRQQPRLANVVLIAITGYGHAEDRQRALDAGIDHHMVKPPDLAALGRILSLVRARPAGD